MKETKWIYYPWKEEKMYYKQDKEQKRSQDGRLKHIYINNYIIYKWAEHSNSKKELVRMDKVFKRHTWKIKAQLAKSERM